MHTIKEIASVKDQAARQKKLGVILVQKSLESHTLACEDLFHAARTGDVTLCKHLFDVLGGSEKGASAIRTASLKNWFFEMSGQQIVARKEGWGLKKGWAADKFKLELAEKTPYYAEPEREPKNLSLAQILNSLAGYVRKVDRAVETDTFNGDPEAAKAILSDVISLANERAKRLTKQQTGEISDKADTILKDGEVSSEPSVEAAA